MVACLLCSSPRSIGVLCTAHGVAIASPGITSEQIFSRVQNPVAALIDAWGVAHALGDGSKIGRDPRVDVAVLHASVSSEHASMKLDGGKWHIVDNSSRNGTEVEGNRIAEQELANGATIRLGDVKFYFWPEALPKNEPPRGSGRTAPTRRDELVFSAKVVTPRGHQLDLRQRVDGGVLRIGESSIELAAMELACCSCSSSGAGRSRIRSSPTSRGTRSPTRCRSARCRPTARTCESSCIASAASSPASTPTT
jgi:pSer/pThr/pTyr-binding forkhead associated (FHA) protein